MTRDGGTGKMTYTGIPLGLLGLPWSDLTEKAWNQTFNASQVTRFTTWRRRSQHTTPALSRKGSYLLPSN